MRIVDTVISREGGNSAWANVVFVGDGGETVTVRLPCPSPLGGPVGRTRIIERAMRVLSGVVELEASGLQETPPPAGRFGTVPEAPLGRPDDTER